MLDTGGRYNPSTDSWTCDVERGRLASPLGSHGDLDGDRGGGLGRRRRGSRVSGIRAAATTLSPIPGRRRSPQNAPEPRAFPTTVWTGNMMILWGGIRGEEPAGNGGATIRSPTPESDLVRRRPSSARVFHTAVWTGSRMIVWGGEPCPNIYDKGLSFTIRSRTRGARSTTSRNRRLAGTTRRSGPETGWWSGEGSSAFIRRLRWQRGSRMTLQRTAGRLPRRRTRHAARQDHTAVWTGSSMLVWGQR